MITRQTEALFRHYLEAPGTEREVIHLLDAAMRRVGKCDNEQLQQLADSLGIDLGLKPLSLRTLSSLGLLGRLREGIVAARKKGVQG